MISFFVRNEKKIVFIFGIFVVALVSFTFGVMKSKKFNYEPMTIFLSENPSVVADSQNCDIALNTEKNNTKDSATNENIENKMVEIAKDCVFVGSKKGTKYYPPSCEYAKKIKAENLRCFSSDEDAKNKGYTKTTSCK